MDEIMVSVDCLVYKHEKYLRKCLDSLVNQKTDFKYEILVHDDASPDGSPNIIKEYEEKYPDLIVPIYQTENQFSKIEIDMCWAFQFPRARGKYIAFCEGDDYWTDEYKLQKQFDAMEAHPECSFCTHRVAVVSEDDKETDQSFPEKPLDSGVYDERGFLDMVAIKHSFQTSSYFIRADILKKWLKEGSSIPKFVLTMPVGDKALLWLGAASGKLYYLNDTMSHYRTASVGSWSATTEKDREYGVDYRKKIIKASEEFNEFTDYRFDDIMKDQIVQRELTIELIQRNYKKMLSSKYKKYFRQYPLKLRLKCIIGAFCPWVVRLSDRSGKSTEE